MSKVTFINDTGACSHDESHVFKAGSAQVRPAPPADPIQLLTIREATRYRPAQRVLTQESGDSVLLLAVDGGMYFSLDGVGFRVWALCDGTRSVEEVVDAIFAEYDSPRAVIDSDVRVLIEQLGDERLLVDASE